MIGLVGRYVGDDDDDNNNDDFVESGYGKWLTIHDYCREFHSVNRRESTKNIILSTDGKSWDWVFFVFFQDKHSKTLSSCQ